MAFESKLAGIWFVIPFTAFVRPRRGVRFRHLHPYSYSQPQHYSRRARSDIDTATGTGNYPSAISRHQSRDHRRLRPHGYRRGGYDAGVRLGEQVAKNMIAVRIGPDMRMAVVGAPSYFAHHPIPQTPQDLPEHNCINIRLPTYGGLFPWDLEKDGQEVRVRVEGQLVFNNVGLRLASALEGLGLTYMPEDLAMPYVSDGRLLRVLEDWCPPFTGYHLYYPSRRHLSPAFAILVDALRFRS